MSKSPATPTKGAVLTEYFQGWNALAAMIRRGQSFSGRERNCAFLNIGSGRWADVSAVTGLDLIDDGRAVALSDWDHDGDLDLWIANRTGPRIRYMQNNIQTKNHSLQIRLVGNRTNRDAIGARVELHFGDGRPTLIKSLRAGGGFVSQSSKWIHFGLGAVKEIDHVVVHWPDGFQDVLREIRPDRRYTIVQGRHGARIESQPRNVRSVSLVSSVPLIPAQTDLARIVLTRRRTLPELEYETIQGERLKLETSPGKPLLINLWASWCTSCVAELSELAASEAALREYGLSVVALRTDELTSGQTDDRLDTEEVLSLMKKLKFPFDVGSALPETLKELTLLQSKAIYRERLPLPTSFLVDAQGRLAVIYKGRVTTEQLLSDLRLIRNPDSNLADAFPFPGRNGIHLFPMTAVDIAAAYEEGGYFDDAEQEMVRYLVKTRRAISVKTLKPSAKVKENLERTYLSLATMLRRQGREQESVAVLEQAIKLFPKSENVRSEPTKRRNN